MRLYALRTFVPAFLAALVLAGGSFGQNVEGGVINGRAVSLPKPVYSDEARRLNLGGTVVVDITVDETGNVIAAHAADGPRRVADSEVPAAHPILRDLAEDAARQARFRPTTLSGKPVKVTGTIVYNIGSGERQPPNYRDAATARLGSGGEPSAADSATIGGRVTADTLAPEPPPPPEPKPVNKQISGGVLNGKAQNLAKPVYPPAAKAVNAEGAVTVQVVIDEDGRVESASAVSGHPLLRAAAAEAARESTFAPTMLAGQKVKLSGVIVYNFVGTLTPGILGFELGFAERVGRFGVDPRSLASRLPADWHQERLMLEEIKPAEQKGDPPPARSANMVTVIGTAVVPKLSREGTSSIRSLKGIVEGRLAADAAQHWHYKLGLALGALAAELEDAAKTAANISELQQLEATAPAAIGQHWLSQLRALTEKGRGDLTSDELRSELYEAARAMKNARISAGW